MIETINFELAKDLILITLCAACALYCAMLSQRLRKLNDLKDGVGASIMSLTEAIEKTHAASLATKADINIAMSDMKTLLNEAERTSVKLEARILDMGRGAEASAEMARRLRQMIEKDAGATLSRAEQTIIDLERAMDDVSKMAKHRPSITLSTQNGDSADARDLRTTEAAA